jgi:hypothetical protein
MPAQRGNRPCGRQLADEVARRRPRTTSGYTDNAIVHHGRLDGGVLLLTEPYRRSQLAQTVRLALSGETAEPAKA